MKKSDIMEIVDKTISSELGLRDGCDMHYSTVKFCSNGYIHFYGSGRLVIDRLVNDKTNLSNNKYEFLITTPKGEAGKNGGNGESAKTSNVEVIIKELVNTIHVKSAGGAGGDGGDGIRGAEGGGGGAAMQLAQISCTGGSGGNGGNGGNAGNGGDGAPASAVTIQYSTENASEIIVLAADDTPSAEQLALGGKGGKGGKGGQGGKGGKGGLNSDGITYGPSGVDGKSGCDGKSGADGVGKKINIEK